MDEECAGNPFNDGHCREIQPRLGCRAPLRQGALEALFEDVNAQDPGIITVTSDMNAANLAVVKKVLPKAEIVFKPELPAEITLKPYGDPRNVMISR